MLTAVSLSIRRKKQTILWVSTGLPADAFALVAVPDKAAALLLCPNYILYCQQVRQDGCACGFLRVCYSKWWLCQRQQPFVCSARITSCTASRCGSMGACVAYCMCILYW